ncbi:hypothetical protein PRZ48_012112 [Zasmidium cellare]|uniref:Uncharacterized protein n=1 Tax=Zasmidium cellare TaxID=395010 RepID=A0ABR0E4E9_ZASCE|nr:hypothetical protein PRZ48_012112 [Zasmidium cellare]
MPRAIKVAGSEASPEHTFSNSSDIIERRPLREITSNVRTTRRQAAIKAKASSQTHTRRIRGERYESESCADEDDIESLASPVGKHSEQASPRHTSRSTRRKKTPEAMVDVVDTSKKDKLKPSQNASSTCEQGETSRARETRLLKREAAVLRREEYMAARDEAMAVHDRHAAAERAFVADAQMRLLDGTRGLEDATIALERRKEDVAFMEEDLATRLEAVKQLEKTVSEDREKLEQRKRDQDEKERSGEYSYVNVGFDRFAYFRL